LALGPDGACVAAFSLDHTVAHLMQVFGADGLVGVLVHCFVRVLVGVVQARLLLVCGRVLPLQVDLTDVELVDGAVDQVGLTAV